MRSGMRRRWTLSLRTSSQSGSTSFGRRCVGRSSPAGRPFHRFERTRSSESPNGTIRSSSLGDRPITRGQPFARQSTRISASSGGPGHRGLLGLGLLLLLELAVPARVHHDRRAAVPPAGSGATGARRHRTAHRQEQDRPEHRCHSEMPSSEIISPVHRGCEWRARHWGSLSIFAGRSSLSILHGLPQDQVPLGGLLKHGVSGEVDVADGSRGEAGLPSARDDLLDMVNPGRDAEGAGGPEGRARAPGGGAGGVATAVGRGASRHPDRAEQLGRDAVRAGGPGGRPPLRAASATTGSCTLVGPGVPSRSAVLPLIVALIALRLVRRSSVERRSGHDERPRRHQQDGPDRPFRPWYKSRAARQASSAVPLCGFASIVPSSFGYAFAQCRQQLSEGALNLAASRSRRGLGLLYSSNHRFEGDVEPFAEVVLRQPTQGLLQTSAGLPWRCQRASESATSTMCRIALPRRSNMSSLRRASPFWMSSLAFGPTSPGLVASVSALSSSGDAARRARNSSSVLS